MKKRILKLIFFLVCFSILFLNFMTIYPVLRREIAIIRRYPLVSYDEKMRNKIGANFYDYTVFLKSNLPEEAVVLVPPQRFPWPQTGNIYYLRYFLHPRKLVHGNEQTILQDKNINYALMLWGESAPTQEYLPGWPKFPVKAEEIIFFKNGKTETIKKDFDPQKDMKEGVWGLIKIRRD